MYKLIVHTFAPPVFEGDEEKTRSANLLNFITFASLSAAVFVAFFLPAERRQYAVMVAGIMLIVRIMMRRGYVRPASYVVLAGIFLVLVTTTLTGGGVRASSFGAFTVLIIFSSLLLGSRAAFHASLLSVGYGLVLFLAESLGWIKAYDSSLVSYWVVNTVYFIMTGIMLTLALQMIESSMHRAIMENEERRQVELDLRRRDALQEAVTFSAEQFLRAANWMDVIDEVLKRLGSTIHATHAYLFEDHSGPEGEPLTSMRYEWTASGYPSDLDRHLYQNSPVHQEGFEEYVAELSRGNVRMGTSATFNPVEKQVMEAVGVRSILEVPVFVNGREWGAIGFDDFEKEREWSAAEVDALKIAANVLGAAIKRQLDETVLQNELAQRKALIEELHIQSEESETLRESLASIAGRLEFSEIIDDILNQIKRVVPYDTASVWRIDGQMQHYVAGRNVPPEVAEAEIVFPIEPGNSAYPILNGDVPYILNLNVQEELKDFQTPPHTYVQSWLAIPLKTRGQIIGLIALDGREKNQFTLRHAELAAIFANQVAIALDNSVLFTGLQAELSERKQVEINLRQRESILAVVAEAANLLLKSPDWKLEIDSILKNLGITINASHAYLCENHLRSDGAPVSSMIFEWTAPGFPSDLGNPFYQNVPLREPDFESWHEIMNSGVPFIGDARHISPEDMDFQLARGMKSLLDVPIFVDGSWWGTIGFDDMAVAREWTSSEVDALLVAGNILGAAIKRRQVEVSLRQREAILEVVAEAADRLMKEAHWQKEIDNILERLGTTIAASHAYIFENHQLPDGTVVKSMRFEWTDSRSTSDLGNPRYINSPISKYEFLAWLDKMNRGVPFVGDYTELDPVELKSLFNEGMKALLDVPIYVEGQWWGIIGFDDMVNLRDWTSAEIDALVAAANVLGAAIQRQKADLQLQDELSQRKQLISELEARNEEAETLRESAAAVALSLDFDETVSRILDQLQRVVPFDSASVQLLVGDELEIVGGTGFPKDKDPTGMRFVFDKSDPSYPILSDGLPYVYYPNIQEVSDRFKGYFHDHIRSWLAVPLIARGELVGIFALDGFTTDKITEAHARFAATFANQAAVTLENARLYGEIQAELRKQVALRGAITAITSSLHLNEVLGEICKQTASTIDATSAYIANYDESLSSATIVAEYLGPQVNELEQVSDLGATYFKKDGALIFEETDETAPAVIHVDDPNLTPWLRNNLSSYGGKSVLYIPLYIQGRLIGHTELWESRRIRNFTAEEISFCRTISQQTAIAIENARLFADLQTELAMRKELIAELESKNTELERFTYTVSHDLKSPLFTIRGFLGYLQQDAFSGDTDRLENDIRRIVDATDKMQHLLNDLLELSRIGRVMNEPQRFQFGQLIHEVLELLHGQIHERGVQVTVQEALPEVFGDRQRLLEVVQNLVENAVKFLGDQPDPRIEIGQVGRDPESGHFIFYIRDNGIGIAPEHHERIFGLFNKLDPKSEGTGIGLALVKRIIEIHGGWMRVESVVGVGSTFFFTLPGQPKPDSVI